jgi:hypothetical protein
MFLLYKPSRHDFVKWKTAIGQIYIYEVQTAYIFTKGLRGLVLFWAILMVKKMQIWKLSHCP